MNKTLNNTKITPIQGTNNLKISSAYGNRTFYNNITKKTVTGFHNGIDITNGNFILAGHSGTGRIAFFDDLDKLIIDDTIIVYYNNIKYIYQINNIESIIKDGTIEIKRDFESMITLTTCNQENKNEQLVITGILVSKENY